MKLIYVTDPYCCWCYGFSAVVQRIARALEDRVPLQTLSPGMINGRIRLAQLFSSFPDPVGLHQRITTLSGCSFGEPYLEQLRDIRNSRRIVDSSVPARALAVLRRHQPEASLAHATAIQEAYYFQGRDLQDEDTYKPIVDSFGIDHEVFMREWRSNDSAIAAQKEFDEVARIGVSGYPAVLLELSSKRIVPVLGGFVPYDDAMSRIVAALKYAQANTGANHSAPSCSLTGQGC